MKKVLFKLVVLTSAVAAASQALADDAVPEVTAVTMTQISHRNVKIDYTVANAPAVITVDIETNDANGAWVSIGGEHIQRITGDCWKKVQPGAHTLRWDPSVDWPGHKVADGGARAVVKAWATDNTPDYMVVDISDSAQPDTQKYYPSVEFLPGGLLKNPDYRTTSVVMRKIMAKDVEWTMGSATYAEGYYIREKDHKVTLRKNYYIGVFEVTQLQWEILMKAAGRGADIYRCSHFNCLQDYTMRPVEKVCYWHIRKSATLADDPTYDYPADPCPDSYLGLLRTRTGIDFDLPSEAQWEFACRAGHADMKWGDGSSFGGSSPDANLDRLGRYKDNDGYVAGEAPAQGCSAEHGTAVVGSYAPNDWGLYDMAGNVWEWALGAYKEDITDKTEGQPVNENDPTRVAVKIPARGGSWCDVAPTCRISYRFDLDGSQRANFLGFRLACYAGLE